MTVREETDLIAENYRLKSLCRDKENHLNGYRIAADEDRAKISRLTQTVKEYHSALEGCVKIFKIQQETGRYTVPPNLYGPFFDGVFALLNNAESEVTR